MYRLKQLILALGDLALAYVGLFFAVLIRTQGFEYGRQFENLLLPMTGLFLAAIIIIFIVGGYDIGAHTRGKKLAVKILSASIFWTLLGTLYFYLVGTVATVTPKTILALTALIFFTFAFIWHSVYTRFVAGRILKSRLIFIGQSAALQELLVATKNNAGLGYEVIGIVGGKSDHTTTFPNLDEASKTGQIDLIVIDDELNDQELNKTLYSQLFSQVSILTTSTFYERIFGRVPPTVFSDSWFITNLNEQEKRLYDRARIILDYLIGLILFIFFIATFPIIALLIKLTSKGPVLFKQTRVGRLKKEFTVYKYRTMQALSKDGSAELNGPRFATLKDPRITAVGRLLRASRLDEIPQCINLIRGEMSFIGPRPERPEFVAELTRQMPYYQLRLLIKPGLTGWAQIRKSYYGTIDENLQKLEYDIYYIKNRSIWLDLAIILRTIHIVGSFGGR